MFPRGTAWPVILISVAFALAGYSIRVSARDVPQLHGVVVPVKDRSDAEFSRSASMALAQVLVKLTGNRRIGKNAGVGALLSKASNLLLRFGYAQEADSGQLMLNTEFDEQAVAKELKTLGVPIWAKERPDTIAWLIVDEDTNRLLIGGDEPGRLGEVLLARAEARGIPLLLPIMDVEESQHLIYASDWDSLASTSLALSGRYGTPSILVGYLRQSVPGFWDVRWKIQVGEESFTWRAEGDIVDLVIEDGVDTLGDALARRFADPMMLAVADKFDLTVLGVQSVIDYARVLKYLESLDAVTDLYVRSIDNQHLRFEVTAQGGRRALAQSISFGEVLSPVNDQADAYQLLP